MPRGLDLVRASARSFGVKGPSPTGEYKLCCPFCPSRKGTEDRGFKLNARPQAKNGRVTGPWYCYRCAAKGGGDLSWLGPGIVADPDAPKPGDWSEPPPGFALLDTRSIALRPFVDYLRARGVLEQAREVGTGACLAGLYGGRVVVPLKRAGNWLGFSARAIHEGVRPKYRFPSGMDRRRALWGADWVPALKDKQAPIWLVEGVFDALPLYPYGIASFGKNVTDEQLDLLAAMNRPVVVALDGDAWQEARAIAARLALRGVVSDYARLPPGTDPGQLGWKVREHVAGKLAPGGVIESP